MNLPLFIGIMLIFLAFSAIFSASEIAFTSVNRLRLEKRAEKSRGAAMAERVTEHFNVAIATLLIGNNLVNIFASSVATTFFIILTGSESLGSTIATVGVTVVVLIFGEIIPKMIGKRFALAVCSKMALPLLILMVIFRPVTFLVLGFVELALSFRKREAVPSVTEAELATIIETAEEEGAIDEDKSELVQSALSFSDTTVEDILMPRTKLDMLDADEDYRTLLRTLVSFNHTRIPVYEGTVDHIIGVLNANHFYRAIAKRMRAGENPEEIRVRDYLYEPCFVHKTLKLPAALRELREKQLHMLVVLDEYGGTMGIVTMEDILEQIVGDIWDESDTILSEIRELGENRYDVDGMTSTRDFFDAADLSDRDFESEYTTMGGWAIEMLEASPHEGDSFTWRNLYVIVTEMRENLVTRLSVIVRPEDEDGEDEEDL